MHSKTNQFGLNEEQEAMGTASNEGRRQAIIQAMTGNHSQEVIDETLAELGLRDGGRVAYNMGGRVGRAYGGGFGGIATALRLKALGHKDYFP